MSSPQNKQPVTRALSNVGTNLEDLTITQSGVPSSPKGSSKGTEKMVSPGRVRTMKEYEEQMAELKKENFNLKLRIYFIEERQEQMKGLKDVDELFKKNVELSCEMETLKKDLSEKEDLLLQSAKAMEILQSQHKKQIEDLKYTYQRERTYLEDHISNLQKILKEKDQTISQFDDSSAMYAMAFGYNKGPDHAREVEDLKLELNNVTVKVVQLEEQVQEERQKYFALESELEQAHEESAKFKNQIKSLETDVEKRDARLQQAYVDLDRKTEQLNAITHKIKKDKLKAEQIADKDQKVCDLESKISELERRLQAGGVNMAGGNRKSSSGDVASSCKDGAVVRQRLRRGEEKGLTKQLQDAHAKLINLEEQVQTMQTRLHETQLSCDNKDIDLTKLNDDYQKACIAIKTLLKQNKLREKEVAVLQSEIGKKEKLIQEMALPFRSFPPSDNCENGDKSNESLRKQLDLAQQKIAELAQERNASTSDMETQMQNLKLSLQEKEIRLKELEEKMNAVSMAECKDNRTAEMESKLEEMKIKLQRIQNENEKFDEAGDGKSHSSKDDKLLIELEAKKKECECLKSELKKRTFNLQELVNKELWDKNREIEKLNKLCERRQLEIIQLKQQVSSNEAQVSFAHEKLKDAGNFSNLRMREVQIMNFEEIKENCSPVVFASDDKKTLQDQLLRCWEEKKFLVRKVEELEERLQNTPERDSDSRLIQTLKSDLNRARQEVESAEKSRKEVIAAYSLLTNRLQELADFLDSLLPSLGAKKRRVVKQAVERSRELSRSLSAAADDSNSWQNLQPSLYAPLLPDFSTVDFWSGDDITDLTLEEEANEEVETISQLRSKVESLEEELKQKDVELNKLNSQYTPTFQSMWSIGTNEFESLGAESNNLAKLVSMFENLETNEGIDNIKEDQSIDCNLDSFITGTNNILPRNEIKSSNIGEIVISSKKVSSKDDKSGQNIGSESEAWSEPDRSVSLARIGLTDDTTAQSWVHDESSDTTDNGQKNSLGGKRPKYDASELKRLQNKVHSLEEANEALRGELSILHKLAPPGLSSTEDKSTSIEGFTEAMPIPPNVLDEIRNQREKLESAIYYNDNIRRQLEAIFASLKVQDKDCVQMDISKDDLTKMNGRYVELENQCKALESQCNDVEVALHTERSACMKKEEEIVKLDKELTSVKEEEKHWKEKAELLQSKIDQLENELKLKCNALIECQNDAQKQYDSFQKKVIDVETQLREETDRWLSREGEIASRMKVLQNECEELKIKLKNCDEEKRQLSSQLETYKLEDDKCKKQLNDLTNRLKECKTKEENLLGVVEEWKLKLFSCQKDGEEARERLFDAELKMLEMEKINSELEMGLRGQVEAASRQCSQAEYKMKDLEMKQKQREAEWRNRMFEAEREQSDRVADWRRQLDAATLTTSEMVLERTRLANDKLRLQQEIRQRDTSQLERVKSELERRVVELEAANSELETRLTALEVAKLPSDSENEDQENNTTLTSTKHLKWPSTSTSPPLSPSSKPVSPHLPLSPRFTRQNSNDVTSDYMMSDQDNGQTCSVFWPPPRSPVSASPDLGIESDQGRLSSLETNTYPHIISLRIDDGVSELAKLEQENVYLRQHLIRTRQALENTLTQLTAANHKKRQVERAICRQLGKTHLILKKARVNLETDVDGF